MDGFLVCARLIPSTEWIDYSFINGIESEPESVCWRINLTDWPVIYSVDYRWIHTLNCLVGISQEIFLIYSLEPWQSRLNNSWNQRTVNWYQMNDELSQVFNQVETD